MRDFDDELVSGSILRSVWKLSWPIVTLQLINGVNQLLGHIFVGQYVPAESNAPNAAIGVSWQFFLVVVVFVASFIQGMSVLIARYSGKRDPANVGRVMYQTILAALGLHLLIMAPAGYFLTPTLLDFANAEPAVKDYATPYMRFLFVCSGFLFMNFLLINAFQASGDARTPLYLGVLSAVLTALVSLTLITGFWWFPKLGVMGAAVGTCFGPLPSLIIALTLIARGRTVFTLPRGRGLLPEPRVVGEVLRIGIPTGIQSVLLNVGGAILISYVGALPNSAEAQAAYTLCYTQLFSFITYVSFGLRGASATLMGQNIGAGFINRGKTAVDVAAGLGLGWAALLGALFMFVPGDLLALFNATEGPVVEYGIALLRYLAVSGLFLSCALAFTGGMQGAGDTVTPMIIAILTQILLLIGLVATYDYLGVLTANKVWGAILISHTARLGLTYAAFQWGKRWRRMQVGVDPAPHPESDAPPGNSQQVEP